MGVPKFFSAFHKYVGIKRVTKRQVTNVGTLLFDLPSMLHSVAQQTYGYGENVPKPVKERARQMSSETLFEEYVKAVCDEILAIITEVNPRIVGLFFDGVPVGGKIQQQRQRRFWAAQERDPESIFDSNNITVGTVFLRELENRIEIWIKENRSSLPEVVVFSSQFSPGEGEHKMMDFIREESEKITMAGSTIIYGLDTDLFLLSLLLPISDVYLWRKQDRGDIPPFHDIEESKKILKSKLDPESSMSLEKVLRDFVAFTFLLGNDFLPRNLSLENFQRVLPLMIEIYSSFQKEEHRPLTTKKRIIWSNMLQYIKQIAKHESKLLIENTEVFTNAGGIAYKEAIIASKNSLDYKRYKSVYYDHRHRMDTENGGISSKITRDNYPTELVTDYLKTMNFVFDYYNGGSDAVNKIFYYRFHYSPVLSDLINLGAHIIKDIVEEAEWRPSDDSENFLAPTQLLVAVLPLKSSNLYPKSIKSQVEEKIANHKKWKTLFPSEVIKDNDGVTDIKHAPVLVPFFPPNLTENIKIPGKKDKENLSYSWTVYMRKKKKDISKQKEETEILF